MNFRAPPKGRMRRLFQSLPAAETSAEPEAPSRPFFDPSMKLEGQSTVVLLGMSGAGKSTMGNSLVFGDPYYPEGFEVGHGADAWTTHCEPRTYIAEKCRFTVYDSPGVPDTDSAKAFDRFDKIVATIRELQSLNAIIFLIKSDRQEEGDYGVFRTLLKQFSKLPCCIVMACRVDTTDCEHRREVKELKEREAYNLMNRVIDRSQLGRDRVHKFLFHHGNLGLRDANMLRWFLCMMPGLSVARETLLTTGEVEARYEALSNAQTRIEALCEERDDLVKSLEKLDEEIAQLRNRIETWQPMQAGLRTATQIAGGARTIAACTDIYTLGTMSVVLFGVTIAGGVGQTVLGAQIAGWKGALGIASSNRDRLDAQKDHMTEEINSGKVDRSRLEVAREEWEELKRLLNR